MDYQKRHQELFAEGWRTKSSTLNQSTVFVEYKKSSSLKVLLIDRLTLTVREEVDL